MLHAIVRGTPIDIPDSERQPCEIWTRVMGYYRPVENFNVGKKQEHAERVMYSEAKIQPYGKGGIN